MRNKSRTMLASSAGLHTAKSTDQFREEAIFASQFKRRQKVPDESSKARIFSFLTILKACAQKKDLYQVNEVSWSALIGGYAQQGLAKEALNSLYWMQHEGTSPTAITLLSVLNACSHSGLLDEGQMLFDSMREKYGILPVKEHYACMVDLFGRASRFDKAMRAIKMMPSDDYPPVWSALLGACLRGGNVELGQLAFERAIQLDNVQ
ncbi:hypothetical protein L7F22_015822 [Adiantum nelumboides]|nr:hypothetical protein [Adiantum nelumboides]